MNTCYSYILLLVCLSLNINKASAQNPVIGDSLFSATNLLKHIELLSSDQFEGRRTGSNGGIKAQKHIIDQFIDLQVLPLGKSYEQPFKFVDKRKTYHATNILGYIKGTTLPEKYIVISAHFDHEGIKNGHIYNGADDNASGVSALFSFAEYFKSHPPKHSVILAAFDGEELDLQGSKFFIKNPIVPLKNLIVNLNMDMISRSDNHILFAVGTHYNTLLKEIVKNTQTPENIILATGHDGADVQENWTHASDHSSFHKKNIPFLYFGVEDHKDYHKPTDDYENIQPDFYINAVKTIIEVFKNIDNSTL
ncbi:M28 family peptidase [Mariniflexile ostreae]|uniref:M28 family peptidase n=1 Tax=Mariniflexile ostreae TaxID=1520892 RepID=A0ABV5F9J4_9FLAO